MHIGIRENAVEEGRHRVVDHDRVLDQGGQNEEGRRCRREKNRAQDRGLRAPAFVSHERERVRNGDECCVLDTESEPGDDADQD